MNLKTESFCLICRSRLFHNFSAAKAQLRLGMFGLKLYCVLILAFILYLLLCDCTVYRIVLHAVSHRNPGWGGNVVSYLYVLVRRRNDNKTSPTLFTLQQWSASSFYHVYDRAGIHDPCGRLRSLLQLHWIIRSFVRQANNPHVMRFVSFLTESK